MSKRGENCATCANLVIEKNFSGQLYKCQKSGRYYTVGQLLETNCLFGLNYKKKGEKINEI